MRQRGMRSGGFSSDLCSSGRRCANPFADFPQRAASREAQHHRGPPNTSASLKGALCRAWRARRFRAQAESKAGKLCHVAADLLSEAGAMRAIARAGNFTQRNFVISACGALLGISE